MAPSRQHSNQSYWPPPGAWRWRAPTFADSPDTAGKGDDAAQRCLIGYASLNRGTNPNHST